MQYVDPTVGPLDTLDLARADLLVVLGGPIGAYDEALYPSSRRNSPSCAAGSTAASRCWASAWGRN